MTEFPEPMGCPKWCDRNHAVTGWLHESPVAAAGDPAVAFAGVRQWETSSGSEAMSLRIFAVEGEDTRGANFDAAQGRVMAAVIESLSAAGREVQREFAAGLRARADLMGPEAGS